MMKKRAYLRGIVALLLVCATVFAVRFGWDNYTSKANATVTPEQALKVVAQATQATVTDGSEYDGKYVLRFTSSIDKLEYDAVGFEVTYFDAEEGASKKLRATTTTVFKRIVSTTEGVEFEHSPKIVDNVSEYLFTAKLPVEDVSLDYTVRAFWIKNAGDTREYGPSRCVCVNDGDANKTSANVSFKADNTEGITEDTTLYANGIEADVLSVVDGYVNTRLPEGTIDQLKSVTKFVFTTDKEGQNAVGSTIYRNYSTKYTESADGTTDTADTSWYEVYKDDSSVKSYVIATEADFYGIAKLDGVEDFAGKTIYLASDIVANKGSVRLTWDSDSMITDVYWEKATTDGTEYMWEPIGVDTDELQKPFMGTFDGQGHTISGLYIKKTGNLAGMFEWAGTGSIIRDFRLISSLSYSTGGYNGMVAGKCAGKIEEVYCKANVKSGGTRTGGIVGEMCYYDKERADGVMGVYDSWFEGYVIGTESLGGIVGEMYVAGSAKAPNVGMDIKDCLNTAYVQGKATSVGGILGRYINPNTHVMIEDCLMAGTMKSVSDRTTAHIVGAGDTRAGFGQCTVKNTYATNESYTNKKIVYEGTFTVLDKENVDITANTGSCFIPASVLKKPDAYALESVQNMDIRTKNNPDGKWTIQESGVPVPVKFATTPIDVAWFYGDANTSVYEIATAEELYGFSVISQTYNFNRKTVKLTADITLNSGDASIWQKGKTENVRLWTPIANIGKNDDDDVENKFHGCFDGQEHTISGVYVDKDSYYYGGLFGAIEYPASVQNLHLTNSYIHMGDWGYAGSVVGASTGQISNIYSNATVQVDKGNRVGGIVGEMYIKPNVTEPSLLHDCWFDGTVIANGNISGVGGIVGEYYHDDNDTTEQSQLRDCLVTGQVVFNSTNSRVGGIAGAMFNGKPSLVRCYMKGGIQTTTTADAATMVGYTGGQMNLQDCYVETENLPSTIAGRYLGNSANQKLDANSKIAATLSKVDLAGLFVDNMWDANEIIPKMFTELGDDFVTVDDSEFVADTFASQTNVAEFQTIPLMQGRNTSIGTVEDFGNGDYMVKVSQSTVSDYLLYLEMLEQAGFNKHSDNGSEAMEGYVYTSAYTKGSLTVVVYHIIRENATFITASYNRALSDYMIYKEEYMDGVTANDKTKVHLFQLANNGACIIIQLKNGHFVIHDGGNYYDAPYFMDYMRTLVPEGEKIVVEGWFISHPHADHYGVLQTINNNATYASQFIIDGVYFHYPHKSMGDNYVVTESNQCVALTSQFVDQNGNPTKMYRPQLGQRYYFCDTIVDICLTTEQLNPATHSKDTNDTSFWCKTFIDGRNGQTLLINGDSARSGHNRAIELYDASYFVLDVYAVSHHGMNVYQNFVDYITPTTILYPCFRDGSLYKSVGPNGETYYAGFAMEAENEALRNKSKEYFSHGLGTVVMTFPYKVHEAERLPICKWLYDDGIPPGRTEHPPYGDYEWGWRVWDPVTWLPID